jgi:hypothetical protein
VVVVMKMMVVSLVVDLLVVKLKFHLDTKFLCFEENCFGNNMFVLKIYEKQDTKKGSH